MMVMATALSLAADGSSLVIRVIAKTTHYRCIHKNSIMVDVACKNVFCVTSSAATESRNVNKIHKTKKHRL